MVTYRPGPENTNADGLSKQCWTWEDDVDAVEGTTPLGEGKSQRRCLKNYHQYSTILC